MSPVATADVLVVGAGPAGLAAAWALRARGANVLLVDAGPALDERSRVEPRSVVRGVGGAGLYSDGKFSFYPAAEALWALRDREALARSYEQLVALLAGVAVTAPPLAFEPHPRERAAGWSHKRYPSVYATFEQRRTLTRTLFGPAEGALLRTRVTGLVRVDDGVLEATLERDGVRTTARAPEVVLAGGRFAPRSIETSGLATSRFRRVELGLRIEGPSDHPLFAGLEGVDPKWIYELDDGGPSLRTFCLCRDGEVVHGDFDGAHSVSGRADGPPTGRSNIGLLVRWTRPCSEAEGALRAALGAGACASVPLARVRDPGDLSRLMPRAEQAGFAALQALALRFGGLREREHELTLHGPCIEGLGRYLDADDDLRAAPGVRVVGDGAGSFRGLTAALVSGLYAAARWDRSPK